MGAIIGAETTVQKDFKKANWDKLLAVLFLRNAEHGRYEELLVDYRKSYTNRECKYPINISDMIDVMRQQPEKKNPKTPRNDYNRDEDKNEENKNRASGFAQKKKEEEESMIACYCFGDKN